MPERAEYRADADPHRRKLSAQNHRAEAEAAASGSTSWTALLIFSARAREANACQQDTSFENRQRQRAIAEPSGA